MSKGNAQKYKISVYLDTGVVDEYEVEGENKAREHSSEIVKNGWRSNDEKTMEVWPPHRIKKVKVDPAPSTNYPVTRNRGT